jgi:hypothetical protein
MRSSEVALGDLRNHLGVQLLDVAASEEYLQQATNRVLMVALALQRIEGSSRRLLKRLGIDPTDVLKASQAIRVNSRLANAWKHGLGGQAKNSTILNGVIRVHRADGYRTEAGKERVHVVGMIVVDAIEGSFASNCLFETCVRDWVSLLQPILSEAQNWGDRVAPMPRGPIVGLSGDVKSVVPLDATVSFAIPGELAAKLKAEALRRAASA